MRELLFVLLAAACAHRPQPRPEPATVLFLCPHGAAKSVLAASYFNQLAAERQLAITAVAAATDEPYAEVPPRVAEALRAEGVDVGAFKPRRVDAAELASATRIVTIDCSVPVEHESWSDVPKLSDDFDGSVRAIRRHVAQLVDEMSGTLVPP